jgi:hypothetical protein
VGDVLHRLVAAFVAPVDRDESAVGEWHQPEPPAPAAIAVLVPPDRVAAVGAAVALGLGRGCAVVAVWGHDVDRGPRAPAQPRARRLAAKLTERGHDALATGRLVVVHLDAPDEAARVAAAAGVATVLVVAGPRDDQVDRVLRDHDQILVAGDDLLADLAVDSARALCVPAETLTLPDAPAARFLATTGVALVAPWRDPIGKALA